MSDTSTSGAQSGTGLPPSDSPDDKTQRGGSGTPGGEGKAGADGSGAGSPGMSQAEAAAFAQRRVKEVVGAELGRLRQAGGELGLEIGRDATLKDVTELVLRQAKELADVRAAKSGGDGDGSDGGRKENTFAQADVNRIVKEKLAEAGKAWQAKEAEYQAKLANEEKRQTAFIVHQELRRLAVEKGLHAQGIIDHVYSPFTDFPYELGLGDKPGTFKVLDKADRTEAINPRTRDVFTLADVVEDLKARKDLSHLVIGKVAGGGGGGADSRSGADGGPARAERSGGRPLTARELFERGIRAGLLDKTKLGE